MTDDQRKRLTEYLGECWHEPWTIYSVGIMCSCGKRSYNAKHAENNRTFTNWPDLGAVKEKLVEKQVWPEFMLWAGRAHDKGIDVINSKTWGFFFTDWLFRPIDESGKPHFCRLVAEWLEQTSS